MNNVSLLSRRERQIMDILYRLNEASAKEVMADMLDAPSYSSVRTLIRRLADKGHVSHRKRGSKYSYFPLVDNKIASQSALMSVAETFFQGSPYRMLMSVLDIPSGNVSKEEWKQLEQILLLKRTKNQ
ncbi:MAG: BlaI/MecI/CopY family transcriptional regulator [Gammaproteobacteria bacterium]|nr:BlaI/MecI/CopY family transcriptional regulator [Gammaproteobacteria bacterium]